MLSESSAICADPETEALGQATPASRGKDLVLFSPRGSATLQVLNNVRNRIEGSKYAVIANNDRDLVCI